MTQGFRYYGDPHPGRDQIGLRFDNRCCWMLHFKHKTIDVVRAYLDSAMVARLFEENPI
ncbi:MAG: hypothetical protein WA840_07250 [Caulobacteraceae bacterium]